MTDGEKGTIAVLALLFLWLWRPSGSSQVGLKQECTFPDGSSVLVPLGDACPYDPDKGGQSVILAQ